MPFFPHEIVSIFSTGYSVVVNEKAEGGREGSEQLFLVEPSGGIPVFVSCGGENTRKGCEQTRFCWSATEFPGIGRLENLRHEYSWDQDSFVCFFFKYLFLYRQRCKVAGGRCLEPGNIEFHGLMNETECARLNSLNILGCYLLVETVRGLILLDRLFERR